MRLFGMSDGLWTPHAHLISLDPDDPDTGGGKGKGDEGGDAGGAEGWDEKIQALLDDAGLPTEAKGLVAALKAERQAKKDAADKLAAYEAEKAEAERTAAEKRGEFEGLYAAEKQRATDLAERLTALEARENARLEAVKERNVARIAALPEAQRAAVNLIADDLAPDKLADHLAALAQEQPMPAGGRAGGGAGGKPPVPPECIAEATRHGQDPVWWYEKIWQHTPTGKAWLEERAGKG